jgi:hypothetical protein
VVPSPPPAGPPPPPPSAGELHGVVTEAGERILTTPSGEAFQYQITRPKRKAAASEPTGKRTQGATASEERDAGARRRVNDDSDGDGDDGDGDGNGNGSDAHEEPRTPEHPAARTPGRTPSSAQSRTTNAGVLRGACARLYRTGSRH